VIGSSWASANGQQKNPAIETFFLSIADAPASSLRSSRRSRAEMFVEARILRTPADRSAVPFQSFRFGCERATGIRARRGPGIREDRRPCGAGDEAGEIRVFRVSIDPSARQGSEQPAKEVDVLLLQAGSGAIFLIRFMRSGTLTPFGSLASRRMPSMKSGTPRSQPELPDAARCGLRALRVRSPMCSFRRQRPATAGPGS